MDKRVKDSLFFIFICYILGWILCIIVKYFVNVRIYQEMLIYVFMFTPAIAAFIMRYIISKERLEGSNLDFSKGRYYLYGWLALFTAFLIINLVSMSLGIVQWNFRVPFGSFILGMPYLIITNVLLTILPGAIVIFGEEFGWRDYLLQKLEHIGKHKAFIAIGFIWGFWHYPLIWAGYSSVQYPLQGYFITLFISIVLSYIFGMIYLKTKDLWLICFLHAAYNNIAHIFNSQTITYGPFIYIGAVIIAVFILFAIVMKDIGLWKNKTTE